MTGKNPPAAPWSVKGVERPTRETARHAAQAAGMTVGAWIEQAIRSHEAVLAAAPPTPEVRQQNEVAGALQRAEVRSLESGVERAESRSSDMVIPVALKVQELAHRLVEIEQARVSGRSRPPDPAAVPAVPPPAAEPAEEPPLSLDDDFERFRIPEEPEAGKAEDDFERFRQPGPAAEKPEDDFERFLQPEEPEAAQPAAAPTAQAAQPSTDDFPTPVPPPDDDFDRFKVPEPEPLVFTAAHEIPEDRPHRRSWARPKERKVARRSRFRRAIGSIAGAIVALALGAGSAILVLDHGELIGLPPRLVDPVATTVDRAIDEGRKLVTAADETARHWIHDLRSLFEDAPASELEKPAQTPTASIPAASIPTAEPPKAEEPKAEAPKAEAPPPPPASAVPPPTPVAPPSTAAGPSAAPPSPPPVAPPPVVTPTVVTPQVAAATTPDPAPTTSPTPPPQTAAVPPTVPPAAPLATPPATTTPDSAQSFPTLTQPTEAPPPSREAEDLEKAARSGDVKAQYELGVMAAQPETGNPDYGKAAYWFREAAVQGNASAQYNLGVLYEHGLGVGADDVRALLWYHSASEQGHARAQYNLGVFYAQGRGIPTDYAEAQRWFKRAADQGIAKAFYNLAVLSESGLGGPANPSGARAYLSRAALLGDPDARAALAKKPAPKPDPVKAADAKPSTEIIGAVQHMLTELGYDAGRIDGVIGDKTRIAIRKFQSDSGLPQTGVATEELLELLTAKLGPSLSPTASARPQR